MRFSKVFFPLALAASAIAADPSSTLDAFKEKSKEVIVLVYSIASAPVDTDPAKIAHELDELAQIGAEATEAIENCRQFSLFIQTANAILQVIMEHPVDLGPFNKLIGSALKKWESLLDSVAFALIGATPTCPDEAPQLEVELTEMQQYLEGAERALGA